MNRKFKIEVTEQERDLLYSAIADRLHKLDSMKCKNKEDRLSLLTDMEVLSNFRVKLNRGFYNAV